MKRQAAARGIDGIWPDTRAGSRATGRRLAKELYTTDNCLEITIVDRHHGLQRCYDSWGVRSPGAATRKLDLSCMESMERTLRPVFWHQNGFVHIPLLDLYSMLVVDGRFSTLRIV